MRKRIKLYVSAFRNICYTYNYAEFDKKCVDFTQFLSRTCSESSDHLHTELVQTKFSKGTLHCCNHHKIFWQLIDLLAESNQSISTRFSQSVSKKISL